MATRLYWLIFFALTARAGTLTEYGRRCAEELGVEVPVIDCLDPAATVLPIIRDGQPVAEMVETCDKPALLTPDKACIPGARLHKWRQTNSRGEAVTTMVFCRRTRQAAAKLTSPQLLTHPAFNDVGLIQYNESNHRACWFFMEDAIGKPSRRIPRPWSASWRDDEPAEAQAAEAYWTAPEQTAGGRCIKCHDSGPWIRSPFVAQAAKTPNAVPPNPRHTIHHVELGSLFADWNGPGAPYRIRIDAARYRQSLPRAEGETYQRLLAENKIAPLDSCTRCHNLGKSRQSAYAGLGTCGYLFDGAVGRGNDREQSPAPWMPPRHGMSPAGWSRYYHYALDAARGCCADPERRDRNGLSVCYSE